MNKRVLLTVAVCVSFAVLVVAGFTYRLSQPRILTDYEMRGYGAMMLETPRRFSSFELTDHRGQPFTPENLEGKWTLIFFGFTQCPDICPTTMASLNNLVAPLTDKEKKKVQVVLLSVDPERDSVEKLAAYVPYFNPDFIGLTGSPAEILSLATQLGVIYTKVPLGEDNYTLDHSGNIVLINPRGDYHGLFRPPFEEGGMRVALRSLMNTFKG